MGAGPRKTIRLAAKSVDRTSREYEKNYRRIRKHGDEKSIHLLRVSTRRLLAMMDLFNGHIPASISKKARKRAKGIFAGLGPLRDLQIQIQLLPSLTPETDDIEPFYAELRAEAEILAGAQFQKLPPKVPGSIRKTVRAIVDFLETTKENRDGTALGLELHHKVDTAFRKVRQLASRADPSKPETIHALRIAFKRFRYMAEFLAPLTPSINRETLDRYRWFQQTMGDIQDICGLEGRLSRFTATRPVKSRKPYASALNEVRQERDARIQKLMKAMPEIPLLWEAGP